MLYFVHMTYQSLLVPLLCVVHHVLLALTREVDQILSAVVNSTFCRRNQDQSFIVLLDLALLALLAPLALGDAVPFRYGLSMLARVSAVRPNSTATRTGFCLLGFMGQALIKTSTVMLLLFLLGRGYRGLLSK